MKTILFTINFLLHFFFIYAQKNEKQFGVFVNAAFPISDSYKTGYGGGVSFERLSSNEKNSFSIEASFNHFDDSFSPNLNMNYIAVNPGYKIFASKQFYIYGGGGLVLELPAASNLRTAGVLLNAGVGYKITVGRGYINVFPRFNVIGGDTFVRYWFSTAIGYSFILSSKAK